MKFLQPPQVSAAGALLPYFKMNDQPAQSIELQVRINKMVNKYSVNYHPSFSGLTSNMYPLIFL